MENIKEVVCKNFNSLVEKSDLTKREIARQMGVSETTIQRWRTGENCPEIPNLETLAKVLEINPLSFFKTKESAITMNEAIKALADFHGYRIEKIKRSEDELTDMIASLDEDDRKLIIENIKTLSSHKVSKKSKAQ